MDRTTEVTPANEVGAAFDENYYRSGCGYPYARNDHWLGFFAHIAEEIIRSVRPGRVFDAGCAMGMLVEAFWDRGVEACGVDVSSYAISQVRRDMAPYCQARSLTQPLEDRFDLVTCIEVLEHMPEVEAVAAVANMGRATEVILFSSNPTDFNEPTHINVHPVIYWLKLFAAHGFWPDVTFDASFVAPHAILFRHQAPEMTPPGEVLGLFSEFLRFKAALVEREQRIGRLNTELAEANQAVDRLSREQAAALGREAEAAGLRESLRSVESAREEAEEKLRRQRDECGASLLRVAEVERHLRQSQGEYAKSLEQLNNVRLQLAETEARTIERQDETEAAASRERNLAAQIARLEAELSHGASGRDALAAELERTRLRMAAAEVDARNSKCEAEYARHAIAETVSSPGWRLLLKYREWLWSSRFSSRMARRWGEPSVRWLMRKLLASEPSDRDPASPVLPRGPSHGKLPVEDSLPYDEWARQAEPAATQLFLQTQLACQLSYRPKISVLTPVYKVPLAVLREMVDSVRHQTYDHWELCIAHGDPADQGARDYLTSVCREDARIKVEFLDGNLGISGNSNKALDLCSGEFAALLDHDDTLAPFALFEVAELLNRRRDVDFIYSDKDHLFEDSGTRSNPLFKPQWSPDVMLSANYLTHLCVIRTTEMRQAGGWRPETDGAQDWDLFLRILERTPRIAHIPKVLYHWRKIESSVALRGLDAKPYASDGQLRALRDHLERGRVEADIAFTPSGLLRLAWKGKRPTISLIVVASGSGEFVFDESLQPSLGSSEVFIVPADESARIPAPRNTNVKAIAWSAGTGLADRLNLAAERCSGEVLIFLDAGTRPACAEWIDELAHPLRNPEIGAVGGKFFDPQTSAIRHAGLAFNSDGSLQYPFAGEHDYFCGPFGGANWYRNWLAVSGACFSTRRDVFLTAGGFSQRPACHRMDVDYCLKLILDLRLRVQTNPFARMWQDRISALEQWTGTDETAASRYLLDNFPDGDPYFSPNLMCSSGQTFLRVPQPPGQERDHNFAAESRALVRHFDCTPADVQESIRGCAARPLRQVKRLTWFIPQFDNPFYGGIHTILRFADYFQRAHQVQSAFHVLGQRSRSRIGAQIARVSEPLASSSEIHIAGDPAGLAEASVSDAGLATLWSTAYHLLRFNNTGRKFYFLQDYEPLFYPAGSTSALVEATYRFGFHGICNTIGVRDLYLRHGGKADYFEPCVDTTVFHRPARERGASPYILFCYARPGHSRNCFELLAESLRKLKRRMGEQVSIVTAGEAWDPASFDLDGVAQNLGLLDYRTTGALYRMSHAGVMMMMTCHPSYLPLELMACGSLVITNRNEDTQWLLRDGENCLLADTSPGSMAEAMEEGLRNRALRDRIAQNAASMVERKYRAWDEQAEKVYQCIYSSL